MDLVEDVPAVQRPAAELELMIGDRVRVRVPRGFEAGELARGKNRLRILYFDSTGMWVFARRLERGTFAWPQSTPEAGRLELRYEELLLLPSGLDTDGLRERTHWRRRAS